MSGVAFNAIYRSLEGVIARLEYEKADIKRLETGLADIQRAYTDCENNVAEQINAKKSGSKNGLAITLAPLNPPIMSGPYCRPIFSPQFVISQFLKEWRRLHPELIVAVGVADMLVRTATPRWCEYAIVNV